MILRQSTSQAVRVGPFVDSTDGVTPEAGLTIANTDVKISKDGAAFANKNSGGATADGSNGWYSMTLDATDTATVGILEIEITVSGALPVFKMFYVVEEAVYDALYAASAAGPLQSTTAGRTLDVAATGEAGLDFGNVTGSLTNANLAFVDSNERVDIGQWLGTAVTTSSTTSKPEVDAYSVSDDDTAANNIELMYDGTGYTDDTGPASRSQVDQLSVTGAAVNVAALASPNGFVLTTGSEANNEDSTVALDGTRHELSDTAGTLEGYYIFDIGTDGVPTSVTFTGVYNGGNDDFDIWVNTGSAGTPSWSQRGTLEGTNSGTNVTHTFTLFSGDVLSDDPSRVWVRVQATGLTSSSFDTDQVFVSKSVVNRSVGYADGAIWVDTNASNTSTENYVDGVADNPVSTWAAALTLSGQLGVNRFRIAGGSSVTLTGDSTAYQLMGNGIFDLDLNGQTVTDLHVENAKISGTGNGSDFEASHCHVQAGASLPPGSYFQTGFAGTSGSPVTESSDGQYILHLCFSEVAGSGTPHFNFAGAGAAVGFNNRGWTGGFNFIGDSNVTISHECLAGGGVEITTDGGDAEIRGICRSVTIHATGQETVQFVGTTGDITIDGNTSVAATVLNLWGVADTVTDSTTGSGATVTDRTVSRDNINTEADTALSDYDPPTNAEMEARTLAAASYFDPAADTVATVTDVTNQVSADVTALSGSSTAADNLEASALGIVPGACEGTPSTTVIQTDLAEATDDHYIGRIVVFTSGAAAGQASDITDYTGSTGTITVTALTTAPSASDTFVIV